MRISNLALLVLTASATTAPVLAAPLPHVVAFSALTTPLTC